MSSEGFHQSTLEFTGASRGPTTPATFPAEADAAVLQVVLGWPVTVPGLAVVAVDRAAPPLVSGRCYFWTCSSS
jgi:hypothetical protein